MNRQTQTTKKELQQQLVETQANLGIYQIALNDAIASQITWSHPVTSEGIRYRFGYSRLTSASGGYFFIEQKDTRTESPWPAQIHVELLDDAITYTRNNGRHSGPDANYWVARMKFSGIALNERDRQLEKTQT